MTISYEQQRQDVESASRATSLIAFSPLRFFGYAFVSLFALACITTALSHNEQARAQLLQSIRPVLYLAFFFALLFWLSPKLSARKAVLRHTQWTFEDSGVSVVNEVSSGDISWTAFQKYKETRRQFLLYVQKNQAHFIPKRVLSEAEQAELRDLLARHIQKK